MIVGDRGPAVVVSARTAAWLERYANLSAHRVRVRGTDPEISRELEELRFAALSWRGSACGTSGATEPEPAASSEWLSTTKAADLLGVTSGAVRKNIALGHLPSTVVGNRHRVSREDLEHFRQSRGRG